MTNNREDNSTSTSESTIPYYGSRVPRQSAGEVDNIIFNMMDDIKNAAFEEKEETKEAKNDNNDDRKLNRIYWNIRILLISIVILLFVVGTVLLSELTKKKV
ncbi:hypothetical protein BCV72DRAFT_335535 [Rhizopus microsporus var. microsporus]|uniref:Transmembrane protein n=2 Tax=Rhizopus microsporus TaxID=58291 RepID=A0A2G4SN18_RHIZD|nr:uncharacterized protein RHIMIDRAFT_293580 [Rhizopus microsporus ATCC 52813]ORE06944.1 hypothetical protein BCV72DRAFT_335535 [Rhizopus microsporus var. microsporus]PHZ10169.1 hypothetical protein RHIMIDRAFT_293580 [Rhizopus microsporus ATCC 52813]